VYALFTLGQWPVSAWLVALSMSILLITDTVYARLVADNAFSNGTLLDALWPTAYVLLAAAAMHPSMRSLWDASSVDATRRGHARLALLGAALLAAPAVVIIDNSKSTETVVIAAISGVAAVLVAWRIARLVSDADRAHETISRSEARFRALVQHATDIVAVIAHGGEVIYASPSVVDILGMPARDVVGTSAYDHLHPDDMTTVQATLGRLLVDPNRPVTFEARVRGNDGTYRWVFATCTNQLLEPSVRGIVGNFRDIDLRKRVDEYNLSETLALEMMLTGRPVAQTLRVLLQATEHYVGEAHAAIRLAESGSTALRTMAAPSLPEDFVALVDRVAPVAPDPTGASGSGVEVWFLADSGPAELRTSAAEHGLRSVWSLPVSTPDEELIGVLDVYLDEERHPTDEQRTILERTRDLVTLSADRAKQTQQLNYLALHDTLTGLPNRTLAIDCIEQALRRLADRHTTLAVLFVDLDRLKIVNDGLGHDTGDELLVAVGQRLRATVRREDIVARLGGDEFIVLCEDLADSRRAEQLAARAVEALSQPFSLTRADVTVTPSIGIATTGRASDSPSSLLRDADAAMYRAKRRGGARYEVFDEAMHTQAVTRLLTERALRQAITNNELRVAFQRQFDLASGEPVADEALIRWRHPTRGLVAPADFLAVAEETGMIVPIGAWVLEQACAKAKRSAAVGTPLNVSVNVSTRSLLRTGYAELVARCLVAHELEPHRLSLEIAEVALLDDLETTSTTLRSLAALGVHLAVDDFGSGGSSLTYLRQFPFDELKIDRSFVAGLGHSAADDAIVAATINMAHALGMAVSAEGVETEAQRVALIELGCDRAQGYLLAEPVPEPEPAAPSEIVAAERDAGGHLRLVRDEPA
jgi:diguanylate cyclase (GGDEF)-like protein/PAS domain S-box-containing protein